jgi:hypothetical protein
VGGSGVLKLAVVTPAKWYRFWWCEVIEQLVTQRDHHECPRYRLDQPQRGVAGHRPRHDLSPLLPMIWGVLSPGSEGANDR